MLGNFIIHACAYAIQLIHLVDRWYWYESQNIMIIIHYCCVSTVAAIYVRIYIWIRKQFAWLLALVYEPERYRDYFAFIERWNRYLSKLSAYISCHHLPTNARAIEHMTFLYYNIFFASKGLSEFPHRKRIEWSTYAKHTHAPSPVHTLCSPQAFLHHFTFLAEKKNEFGIVFSLHYVNE